MARRRKKKVRAWRSAEVCVPGTKRTARGRKRVVECAPTVEEAIDVHRDNEACACGVAYKDFRSGWTFTDAAEMLGARGGAKYRPSRGRILWMMGKLKRDEWERHQEACAWDAQRSSSAPAIDYDPADFRDDDLMGLGAVRVGWPMAAIGLVLVAELAFLWSRRR